VRGRRLGRGLLAVGGLAALAASTGSVAAQGGSSNLSETSPLIWVITAAAVAGALIVFAFLVYAILRFRDPATRRRRYG
jgi:hypothetical protein